MAVVEFSIDEFFRQLRTASYEVQKTTLRFQLELAMAIQAKTKDNIKNSFGKGFGRAKSPLTEQAYGSSARSQGRSGALFRSVMLAQSPSGPLTVSVGGPGVPYAVIHEKGGTIVPKRARYLTIPFSPRTAGTRAGEHDLIFRMDDKWGPVLKFRKPAGTKTGEEAIAFLLRRKSTIPATPYLQPAVDEVLSHPATKAMAELIYGTTQFEVSVK